MPRLAIGQEDDSQSSDDGEDIESEETGSSSSTSENEVTQEAQRHIKP
jgi:hypothetical protein